MITETKSPTTRSAPPPRAVPKRRRGGQTKQWKLNVRLLIGTLVGLAVLSPAVYFWHSWQVGRNASALLDRAKLHEDKGEWMLAAQDLHRYLQLRPDDTEALVRRAEDFDDGAKVDVEKRRALQLYAAALAQVPDRADLQSRHMTLQLELGDYRAALDEAAAVLKKVPSDPAALRVKALGLHRQWRLRGSKPLDEVVRAYRTAIDKEPANVDLATGLARLYRIELQQPANSDREALSKQADQVIDRLVEASDDRASALLARYLYRTAFNLPDAGADLDRALAADRDKTHFEVWWRAGQRSLSLGENDAAIDQFATAIGIDGADRRGHLGLGSAYRARGDEDRALEAWLAGLAESRPDDIELQMSAASAQIALKQWSAATKALEKLERQIDLVIGPDQAELLSSVALLRADIAKGQDDFSAASLLLKKSLAFRQAGAESTRRAAALSVIESRLGECYVALGQLDQAALAYQRAADLQPRLPGPRFLAARTWELAGRFDEAVRHYEDGLALGGAAPAAYVALANAEYQRQMTSPAAQRQWTSLETMIANAIGQLSDDLGGGSVLLNLIQAEYEAEQGLVDQAVVALKNMEKEILADKLLARRLVFDYERYGRTDESDRILDQLKQAGADALDQVLLASEVEFRRKDSERAFLILSDALSKADDSTRGPLEFRLALMYLNDGKTAEARKLFEARASADPRDVRPLHFLAEMALQASDVEETVRQVDELEKREGPDGAAWRYYRAQCNLLQAGKVAKDDAAQAKKLLQQAGVLQGQLENLRPNWAPSFLLKARVAEATTPPDDATAIHAYAEAIKLGQKSVAVYEALIFLLYRQNRIGEADGYLTQLRDAITVPAELTSVAMAIDIRQGNLARAIETARGQIQANAEEPIAHVRLGQLLAMEGLNDEAVRQARFGDAEVELKKARDLAPSDPRTWAALLAFFIDAKQPEPAAQLLDEVRKKHVLSKDEEPFFLAQGYAVLGDEERSKTYYLAAVEASPDNAAVQLQAASFFFQRDVAIAEKCLRQVLQIRPNDSAASRLLATLLAARGGTQDELDEVWDLLSDDRAGRSIDSADQRLKAILMLRRGGRDYRRRAQQLLETLAGASQQSAPIDRLLLARLYEAQGQMAAAREQLKVLVNRNRPAPEHLAAYIDNLLRSARVAEAQAPLEELARQEPESKSLRSLTLRARWLKEQGQTQSIEPLVEAYLAEQLAAAIDQPGRAKVALRVANLYAVLQLPQAAERFYRQAVAFDSTSYAVLANWLVKQARTSDAVHVCIEAAANDSTPQPAMVLSNVLALGEPTDEDRKLAQPVLDRAHQKYPDDAGMLFCRSTQHLMKGENDEAVRLLRKVLKLQPKNLPAMNNLAFLLSMTPEGREEAADLMDQAIAIGGMNAELLDSKGWIQIQQRKLSEAVDTLLDALSNPPGDPRHRFHLAVAYHLQGKLKEAGGALALAQQGGFKTSGLTPEEQSSLTALEAALH